MVLLWLHNADAVGGSLMQILTPDRTFSPDVSVKGEAFRVACSGCFVVKRIKMKMKKVSSHLIIFFLYFFHQINT